MLCSRNSPVHHPGSLKGRATACGNALEVQEAQHCNWHDQAKGICDSGGSDHIGQEGCGAVSSRCGVGEVDDETVHTHLKGGHMRKLDRGNMCKLRITLCCDISAQAAAYTCSSIRQTGTGLLCSMARRERDCLKGGIQAGSRQDPLPHLPVPPVGGALKDVQQADSAAQQRNLAGGNGREAPVPQRRRQRIPAHLRDAASPARTNVQVHQRRPVQPLPQCDDLARICHLCARD